MRWQVFHGDARERLAELLAGSVQTCVTSPPYFGLRDYGHAGQIGLEPTPAEYVTALVAVFGEVRRILNGDGTLWLNLGDSYCNSDKWGSGGANTGKHTREPDGTPASWKAVRRRRSSLPGIKPKDLLGIPWRVAFALQADGWYLRSDIIWSKPNPMPESVTDRPTKAHEYLFLLSKSRQYYYDAAAIREPYAPSTLREFKEGYQGQATKDYAGTGAQNASDVKRRIVHGKNEQTGDRRKEGFNERWDAAERAAKWADPSEYGGKHAKADPQSASRRMLKSSKAAREAGGPHDNPFGGANKRSVWTVPTRPYPDAHFATFPEALIEPCILAGSKPGDLVLDPFTGSGTTGAVAIRHQRSFVGIELNAAYVEMARARIGAVAPMFASEQTRMI